MAQFTYPSNSHYMDYYNPSHFEDWKKKINAVNTQFLFWVALSAGVPKKSFSHFEDWKKKINDVNRHIHVLQDMSDFSGTRLLHFVHLKRIWPIYLKIAGKAKK